MAKMSDLSHDLVEEILSKVPITSLATVRSTCKLWDVLSKNRILCKAKASHEFLGFMINEFKVCSMRFNLHGLNDEGNDFVDPSIKELGNAFDNVEISQIFQCDGLLLCVTRNNYSLMVWNPYLGQTRWIEPRNNSFMFNNNYAIGYDNNNNRNHKILRSFKDELQFNITTTHEIYDFKSNSWRVLDVAPNWYIHRYQRGVSLKGNTYFIARENIVDSLLCFDFTRESFGEFLPLPFQHYIYETLTLFSHRDEKLAMLYRNKDTSEMEIWITTKIEPDAVSWIPFLKVDMEPLTGFGFQYEVRGGSFFIDEEKKVVVVFNLEKTKTTNKKRCYNAAYVFGENGYLKKVNLGEAVNRKIHIWRFLEPWYCYPHVCSSSYVPSLVHINQIGEGKRKRKLFTLMRLLLFIQFCFYFYYIAMFSNLPSTLRSYCYRFVVFVLLGYYSLWLDNFLSNSY